MDNPQAFPGYKNAWKAGEFSIEEGMTLRDYFAGQTLCGTCSIGDLTYEERAELAYKQADAMLKEREKNES
jgi:hypothetical protein